MLDDTLTLIPGPTPVHERILEALARPTTSHQDPSFVKLFRESLADLQEVALAQAAQPFLVSGSGTLAMEIALVNLVAPGEKLLILSQGYFGDRYAQVAEAFGIDHEIVQAEWGRVVPAEDLAHRLARTRYAAVAMTHVDTSTGSAAPIEEYCRLLRGRDELAITDGVCATGGIEERFDAWGLDVLFTGAQKAFGAPPGLAILLLTERAMAKRRARASLPAYYADLSRWLPVMEDPARYFATPPVNEIVAFHAALRLCLEEGLAPRWARHRRLALAVRAGLAAMGLELVTAADCRADTLSVVRYPETLTDASFRGELARRGIVVAGALGPLTGKAFRIGHMGNIGPPEILRLVHAMEASLASSGHRVEPGAGLAAAAAHLAG